MEHGAAPVHSKQQQVGVQTDMYMTIGLFKHHLIQVVAPSGTTRSVFIQLTIDSNNAPGIFVKSSKRASEHAGVEVQICIAVGMID